MILGLNENTFIGICLLVLGNLLGAYLIPTGSKQTTRKLLNESYIKSLNPVHDLDRYHTNVLNPKLNFYKDRLTFYITSKKIYLINDLLFR